ncbi:atherin-like [Physeter macrocephalus]|uniref:Atherin-like n=1 Tax=Physeter macrocephalus TaxID=9755 RepID=A0A455BJK5_PHYMC|nr:atherin-like [Physeter catodon]|eukprot:XP_028349155.1 atherin-like [Physeter catodon]
MTSARVPPGEAEARVPQNAPFLSPEPPPPPLPLGTPGTPPRPPPGKSASGPAGSPPRQPLRLRPRQRLRSGAEMPSPGVSARKEDGNRVTWRSPRGWAQRRSHVGAGVADRRVPPPLVAFPLPGPLHTQPASPSRDPAPSSRDSPSPVGHRAAKRKVERHLWRTPTYPLLRFHSEIATHVFPGCVCGDTTTFHGHEGELHTGCTCAPPWHRTRTPDPAASCGPCPGRVEEAVRAGEKQGRDRKPASCPGVLQSSGPFGANLHEGCHRLRFTGSFVGLCCRNPRTTKKCALFNMVYFHFPLSKDSSPTFTTFNMLTPHDYPLPSKISTESSVSILPCPAPGKWSITKC